MKYYFKNKNKVTSAHVLIFLDPYELYVVHTDVSLVGLGCVLMKSSAVVVYGPVS